MDLIVGDLAHVSDGLMRVSATTLGEEKGRLGGSSWFIGACGDYRRSGLHARDNLCFGLSLYGQKVGYSLWFEAAYGFEHI